MRVGNGIDVHRLVPGRKLILGGVQVPYDRGLDGHSDADVVLHAVCDALLGAAALDDLGAHFPDTDPAFKDIDSRVLLEKTVTLVHAAGFVVYQMDITVIAQAPRLGPYRRQMRAAIAEIAGIPADRVGLKATTTEGLGLFGRGEGIGAMCTVLLEEKDG
ncbi:MAG: 2-C-methyl-D-erythritol 2,4-cyclodiphosphate synthase [Pseudomonadota bacterium]